MQQKFARNDVELVEGLDELHIREGALQRAKLSFSPRPTDAAYGRGAVVAISRSGCPGAITSATTARVG